MDSLRENLEAFWIGECVGPCPVTVYHDAFDKMVAADPNRMRKFLDAGLMITRTIETVLEQLPEFAHPHHRTNQSEGNEIRNQSLHTPLGTLTRSWRNGWPQNYMIEEESDYYAAKWLIEHTTLVPGYEKYHHLCETMSEHEVALIDFGRTPIPRLMLDWIGPENFALHLYEFPDQIQELTDALRDLLRRKADLIAKGPGHYVTVNEHFSADMLGPQRFAEMLLPAYRETFNNMRQAGKKIGVRFDGRLANCVIQVRQAPFDIIECFTPPPAGDVSLQAARASWPNHRIWCCIDDILACTDTEEAIAQFQQYLDLAYKHSRRSIAFEITRVPEAPNWQDRLQKILSLVHDQ